MKEGVVELKKGRDELMEAKKEHLAYVKDQCLEIFGQEKIPKELMQRMIDIRKQIATGVENSEYVGEIEDFIRQQIAQLALTIAHYKNPRGKELAAIGQNGEIEVFTAESHVRPLQENESELVNLLETYFDTYRMARNAVRFSQNVKEIEGKIVVENSSRKLNFYSEKDKRRVVVDRLPGKYLEAGFTTKELRDLVDTCNFQDLDKLEIHDLKVLVKVRDIFQRFMQGDKTKYVAMSAGLMVPAFISGYAPMFLANALKDGRVDVTQVGLYGLLTTASAGCSVLVERQFTDFLNKNFSKEKGMGKHIATNVAGLPPDQIASLGTDNIRTNIINAKESYEEIYRRISFDILPAIVTLATSATMLYQKSPALAGATAAGAGIMMVLDKYFEKVTNWDSKREAARAKQRELSRKISEHLNAHLEIVLSGMKDDLATRMEESLAKDRLASSDRNFTGVLRDNLNEFLYTLNLIIAGVASYLAGATADKFFASLLYSNHFDDAVSKILKSKRMLLDSFRDIQEMDLMFNGYAAAEEEKEKTRVGMSAVTSGDIDVRGATVEFGGKRVLEVPELHIPEGAMVYLNGATGAGKTTFIKILSGYYRPTAGEVRFGHTDMEKIKKSGKDSIYSSISYLPQFPYILEDTVRKNVIFGLKEEVGDSKVQDVLEEVGLAERYKNLNEPLRGGRGETGTASGGEAARIALARMLLKIRNTNSKLVFLDEPVASVDEETRNDIAEIIKREKAMRPDVTFVVISHDKDFATMLDYDMEVKMKKGKVVAA